MERSSDDIAGFINNNIRSVLKLSISKLNLLGLLVRQDESLYKINAQMRTKKDIIALCINHLTLWIQKKENSINSDVCLEYEDWLGPTVKVIYCDFIASRAGHFFK